MFFQGQQSGCKNLCHGVGFCLITIAIASRILHLVCAYLTVNRAFRTRLCTICIIIFCIYILWRLFNNIDEMFTRMKEMCFILAVLCHRCINCSSVVYYNGIEDGLVITYMVGYDILRRYMHSFLHGKQVKFMSLILYYKVTLLSSFVSLVWKIAN